MREKVMALSRGEITYRQPKIVITPKKIVCSVKQKRPEKVTVNIANASLKKIKGFGVCDDVLFDFMPVFNGKDNTVELTVNAGKHKVGDHLMGKLILVTDCGEATIDYDITVVSENVVTADGTEISSYAELVEYSKRNFQAASKIFGNEKLMLSYLSNFDEKRTYKYLLSKNPSMVAFDEYMMAHGDKKPTYCMISKKQVAKEIIDEDMDIEVVVARTGWGPFAMDVIVEPEMAEFLSISHKTITDADFIGDRCKVKIHVDAAKIKPGKHFNKIIFKSIYQSLELKVRLNAVKNHERRVAGTRKKAAFARLIRNHIAYLVDPNSKKEAFLESLEKDGEVLSMDNGIYELIVKGFCAYVGGDEDERDEFIYRAEHIEIIDDVIKYLNRDSDTPKEEEKHKPENIIPYLLIKYLVFRVRDAKSEKAAKKQEKLIEEIKTYYEEIKHPILFVMQERLGCFWENETGLERELKELWDSGVSSPYTSLFRMIIYIKNPEGIEELDSMSVATLCYGLRNGLASEELGLCAAVLAARNKKFTPQLFMLLSTYYSYFKSDDLIHAICALLIRTRYYGPKYQQWYSLGVQRHIRLTELFEYYMYSIDIENTEKFTDDVIEYFKYENHLKSSVKAAYFANIIKNKNIYKEYMPDYWEEIKEFTLESLKEGKMNDDYAYLYENYINKEMLDKETAKALSKVLYSYEIEIEDKRIDKVYAVCAEGGNGNSVKLRGQKGIIRIPSTTAKLYFTDKEGHTRCSYYIKHKIKKMIDLDELSKLCYENGCSDDNLMIYLFSQMCKKKSLVSEDVILAHEVLDSGMTGIEYREEIQKKLFLYYTEKNDYSMLKKVLEHTSIEWASNVDVPVYISTMVSLGMYDDVIGYIQKYGMSIIPNDSKVALVKWYLSDERKKSEADVLMLKLSLSLFKAKMIWDDLLTYLMKFYMGGTTNLRSIVYTALNEGMNVGEEVLEKTLGQALFCEDKLTKYEDIMLRYYQFGKNKTLIKALLMTSAYRYLTGECAFGEAWSEVIQREAIVSEYDVMHLATLKYLSSKKGYTQTEIDYISSRMEEYVEVGVFMPFMKKFVKKGLDIFMLRGTYILSVYCDAEKAPVMEVIDEGKKSRYPMKMVLNGIFAFAYPMFPGQSIKYRIISASNTLMGEGEHENKEVIHNTKMHTSFTGYAADVVANEDIEAARESYKKYKVAKSVAGDFFKLLGG